MVRLLSLLAFGFLAGLVILIYDMKFETRRLENRAAQLSRAIEDEKDNVALMRAEWSHVTRPERVEKLTREILDLQPVKSSQLVNQQEFLEAIARVPVQSARAENAPAQDPIGDMIRKGTGDDIGALIRNGSGGSGNASPTSPQ